MAAASAAALAGRRAVARDAGRTAVPAWCGTGAGRRVPVRGRRVGAAGAPAGCRGVVPGGGRALGRPPGRHRRPDPGAPADATPRRTDEDHRTAEETYP
ncbi:hypothetical protein ACFWBF_32075 [Streptomyces sp. NPDC060028]|uniref:hypothetical protein n=1 Tax=Streptomyces sp. NPDC060028 TaxID=3347041 RepID=UPI00369912F0